MTIIDQKASIVLPHCEWRNYWLTEVDLGAPYNKDQLNCRILWKRERSFLSIYIKLPIGLTESWHGFINLGNPVTSHNLMYTWVTIRMTVGWLGFDTCCQNLQPRPRTQWLQLHVPLSKIHNQSTPLTCSHPAVNLANPVTSHTLIHGLQSGWL